MKSQKKRFQLPFETLVKSLVILCLSSLISPAIWAETVKISVGDYPPYIDFSANNKGFMTEIVVRSFKEANIIVDLVEHPWKRVEDIDIPRGMMSYAYIRTKEREKKFLFSDEIMTAPTIFVVRKNKKFSWSKIEDLIPYRIGISRGYSYGDNFDSFKPKLKIDIANTDLNNIQKVLADRIDIFPVDPYVGAVLIKKNFSQEDKNLLELVMEPPLTTDAMHLVCSKKISKCSYFIKKFNHGLKTLNQNGITENIISKALETN